MRFALTALVLVMVVSTADAQLFPRRRQTQQQQFQFPNCPNGVCPAPQAVPLAVVPQQMPAASDVPADIMARVNGPRIVTAEPLMHGAKTYKLVRRLAERELTDRAERRGYSGPTARAKAAELMAKITDPDIDVIGQRMAGVKEGIGDGVIGDRIDNIIRLVEAIVKLLLLFL